MTRIAQFVLVTLLIASVVLISALPQPHLRAPYQATHGPTTAFRSLRFQRLLVASIAAAATFVAGYCCPRPDSSQTARLTVLGSVLLC